MRVRCRPVTLGSWLALGADRWFDRPLIDGAVTGVASAAETTAGNLSLTQTGYLRSYVLVFVCGAVVAAVLVIVKAWTG